MFPFSLEHTCNKKSVPLCLHTCSSVFPINYNIHSKFVSQQTKSQKAITRQFCDCLLK